MTRKRTEWTDWTSSETRRGLAIILMLLARRTVPIKVILRPEMRSSSQESSFLPSAYGISFPVVPVVRTHTPS